MKHILTLFATSGILLSLGCAPSVPSVDDIKYEPPTIPDLNIELPDLDIPNFGIKNQLCERKESELNTTLTDSDEKMTIAAEIPQQLTFEKDCEGVKTDKGLQPTGGINEVITILPPKTFTEKVARVEIFNHRNCMTISDNQWANLPQSMDPAWPYSRLAEDGELNISLSTSKLSLPLMATVSEGLNVLDIIYLGSCKDKECQKARLLGTKRVVLDLKVSRPILDGERILDRCQTE